METRSAGGIVLGDSGTIALVKKRDRTRWGFPKGHIEPGETDEEAARREIEEETGLTDLEYLDNLGSYERYRINTDGTYDESEHKEIHLFLFAAPPHAVLAPKEATEEAKWVSFQHVVSELGEKESAWFSTVFPRVREAVQRD